MADWAAKGGNSDLNCMTIRGVSDIMTLLWFVLIYLMGQRFRVKAELHAP